MPNSADLAILTEGLRAASAVSRQDAAERIAALGESAHQAVPALIAAAGDSSPSVRMAVIGTLAAVAAEDEQAVVTVGAALCDPQPDVRAAALDALEAIGPRAKAAIPSLISRLEQCDWTETPRLLALVDLLEAIGPAVVRTGPRLLALLNHMPAGLQDQFSSAQSAERRFAAELWWETTRAAVAGTLAQVRFEPEGVIPRAMDGLRDAQVPMLRARFASVIGRYGLLAAAWVEDLAKVLRSEREPEVRRAVLAALSTMGPVLRPVLHRLRVVLETDPDPEARCLAAQTLGMMGPEALPALPALQAADQEGNEQLSEAVLWAQQRITLQQPHIVEHTESGTRFLDPTPDWGIGEPWTDQGIWHLPLWHEACQIKATFTFRPTGYSRRDALSEEVQGLRSHYGNAVIAEAVEEIVNQHPCDKIIMDGDRHDGIQMGVVYVFYRPGCISPGWKVRLSATMPIASGAGSMAAVSALVRNLVWDFPVQDVRQDPG